MINFARALTFCNSASTRTMTDSGRQWRAQNSGWDESLTLRVALAINPSSILAGAHSFNEFEVRHALRVRIFELERDAAILKSRLRAGAPQR